MLRLLIGVLLCAGLVYWLVHGTGSGDTGVGAKPKAAINTLERNGCAGLGGAPAGSASAANLQQGLQALQKSIEKCQAAAARRAESP